MITLSSEAKRSVLQNRLIEEFTVWFRSVPVDFWDECGAPSELAEIALKLLMPKTEP